MKSLNIPLLILVSSLTIFLSCVDKKKNANQDAMNNENHVESDNNITDKQDYTLVWSDEFEGDTINPNYWNFQVEKAGRFNDEWQRYTNSNENAYIEDGKLVIQANHVGETHGMNQYTSARLNTANKLSWKYGKIVARIKLPHSKGIWPAFWMLGANINENGGDTPWPQCGEIDILELYGSKDDAVIEANFHYADKNDKHASLGAKAFKLDQGIFADDFHEFALEWNANEIIWSVDGNEFLKASINNKELNEFHEEFFLLLNIAVGGEFAGRPDETSIFPQKMYVDWIKVYQK